MKSALVALMFASHGCYNWNIDLPEDTGVDGDSDRDADWDADADGCDCREGPVVTGVGFVVPRLDVMTSQSRTKSFAAPRTTAVPTYRGEESFVIARA